MARPIDKKKRLELALGALDVIRAHGPRTTMAQLARELGMKRSTLYWYFADIPSILEVAIAHSFQGETHYVANRLIGTDVTDPLAMLMAILRATREYYAENDLEDYIVILCQLWATGDVEHRARFRAFTISYQEPIRALLIGTVRRGIADGRIAPCDPEQLIELMLTISDGMMVASVLRNLDSKPLIDFFEATVIEPLRRTPETP